MVLLVSSRGRLIDMTKIESALPGGLAGSGASDLSGACLTPVRQLAQSSEHIPDTNVTTKLSSRIAVQLDGVYARELRDL